MECHACLMLLTGADFSIDFKSIHVQILSMTCHNDMIEGDCNRFRADTSLLEISLRGKMLCQQCLSGRGCRISHKGRIVERANVLVGILLWQLWRPSAGYQTVSYEYQYLHLIQSDSLNQLEWGSITSLMLCS